MNLSPDYVRASKARFQVEPFEPRVGLSSAHAQTILSHILPRRKLRCASERRLVPVGDGVEILALCHWQKDRREALTVVIVHGLEGSSESQYVLGTAAKAWDAGMNVVRMNVRSCGGSEALCKTLYHSGMSQDIAVVIDDLIREQGLRDVALVGFSMGGNQVLKLAGEWGGGKHGGTPMELKGVAAISPAMDLSLSADALHLRSNRIYEWRFLLSLRSRLRRKLRAFPGSVDVRQWWWRSIREFDDRVTAPHCGFRDAEDYYMQSSASAVLTEINVPTLILNSKDDPFIRVSPETKQKLAVNPWVTYYEAEHGGHCAFLASANGYDGRWAERQVVRFLEGIATLS